MKVPASGAVIGPEEKSAMHTAVDNGWLTAGPINAQFERELSQFTGIRHVRTCNSGSSANLLAVGAMVEAGIWESGDEIITTALAFPTTVNALLVYGLVPVFVDVDIPTYNATDEHIGGGFSPTYSAGIMLAHTLGNPFGLNEIYDLPMIEDCCDALGSVIEGRHVGRDDETYIATCSFFPAHHITTGEGGAVFSNEPNLIRHVESIRDWGRDCYCQPGQNNTCGKRFEQQHGELPYGYDHKYTFTHLGFNLKLNEIGAACGVAQMAKLPDFVAARKRNFAFLWARLEHLQDKIILPVATEGSNPSWFGFPITIRETGIRDQMQKYLADNGVDSRLLFAGNITKQPYMKGRKYRIAGSLENTDKVMNDSFWIGLHPALTEEQLAYSAEMIGKFFGEF